jgi:AAA family ATP:ADP antiporter
MQHLLARLFDVREGEGARAFQAAVSIFTLLAGHTMLETARDTLFLQRLEASKLTLVYAVIAAVTLATSPLSITLARRFGRRNALVASLLGAAYGTALLYLMPLTDTAVVVLYTWTGLLGSLLVLQFWLFVSELLTVSQGKRLLGPIAAGGALGAVFGAGSSALLLRWVHTSSLVLVAAGLFVLSALILTTVNSEQESQPLPRFARQAEGAREAMTLVRSEPYVLRLAGLAILSSATLLSMDYLFKSSAARAVPTHELGTFFGVYYAALNAASLTMQLFVASPLIRRIGVVPALAVLPALQLGFGVLAALGGAAFGGVLLIKSSDGALRHSLNRVSSELIQMPLDASVQERVKPFVDGLVPRIAQAATAGLLLMISDAPGHTERSVLWVGLGLALIWLVVAVSLRTPYLQRFRDALARPDFDHNALPQDLDIDAVEAVLEALSSQDETRAISAMELLRDKGRVRLIPTLVLRHENERVLTTALTILAASDRNDWLEQGERLLTHGSESVRAAALRALSLHGRHDALERGLGDPSPAVRAQAAFWLVTLEQVAAPLADPRIGGLFDLPPPERRAAEIALLSAIQDSPHARWTELLLVLSDTPDARLFEQVALAMSEIKDLRFVNILIPRLGTRDGRGAVREALCALGEPALDALELKLADPRTPERVRVHIPRTIAAFKNQRAADILLAQLGSSERSGLVRYKSLRGLGRIVAETRVRVDSEVVDRRMRENLLEDLRITAIRAALEAGRAQALAAGSGTASEGNASNGAGSDAERSLRLVLGLLDNKRQQSLERAFRLLQIRHKSEDIRSVYFALVADDRRMRAHALEFLDVLTSSWNNAPASRELREMLLIVADDLTDGERSARAARFLSFRPRSYAEALRALLSDQDEGIAAFAAFHALALGSSELEQQVAEAMRERPSLNRMSGASTLFPAPLELGHAH